MCRNFTYEVVGQRRKLKAILKNCSSKNKCHFIFIPAEWSRLLIITAAFTVLEALESVSASVILWLSGQSVVA
jgi:hypothetical protein